MSFKAGGQVPAGGGEKASDEPKLDSPDEMIAFARGYFASDFPNPERTGCSKPGTISEIVRAGKQPDAELRAHLFGCSECFVEFDREMQARGDVQPASSWWSKLPGRLLLRPAPLLAVALCFFLITLAGLYLQYVYWKKTAPDIADEQPNQVGVPSSEAPKNESAALTTPQASPTRVAPVELAEKFPRPRATVRRQAPSLQRPRATRQNAGECVAVVTVKVDLEEYTALRGGGGGENAIKLSRSLMHLELMLPEGSVEGLYSLSILDPSGKALVTAKARSANRKAIGAILDIRKLAARKYRLRLLREGEAPQYYPVVVGEGATLRE
jgi:hypothetical protein